MITRSHKKELTKSTAVYSDCELYRYSLTRSWSNSKKKVLFMKIKPILIVAGEPNSIFLEIFFKTIKKKKN